QITECDSHRPLRPEGIDFAIARNEEQIGMLASQLLPVRFQRPWVACEILPGRELRRVDEDAKDHPVGMLPSESPEAEMALVEIAHGRDQPARKALRPPLPHALADPSGGR